MQDLVYSRSPIAFTTLWLMAPESVGAPVLDLFVGGSVPLSGSISGHNVEAVP